MIKQELLLLKYNKDVVCVIDKGQAPMCKIISSPSRRNAALINNNIPSHDPFIPRAHSVLYNCTIYECVPLQLSSLIQVTSPNLVLISCFQQTPPKFECDLIRYNYLKNIDKLLFLKSHMHDKIFYAVDCLVYSDQSLVCHKKDTNGSHAMLVDTGTIVRPNEPSILVQDEFICEESENKEVICDIDAFVPFNDGLKLKESIQIKGDVLLKTGSYVVLLKRHCAETWCGYSGKVGQSRRTWFERYDPPGGKVYRCYYAKKQQICKMLYHKDKQVYNERNYLST